jgi:transcription initiation factor TFIIIB Brf1 subunit/transcription initiation factor TFIIB
LAAFDLSDEEWLELYRHLLAQLQERGFNEIRAEIEAAASAPLAEESTPEEEARISRIVRGEVGRAVIRRRSPEEVFSAAVGVLQSRLIELPRVAAALADRLDVSAERIEFRVDYEQRYALIQTEPVQLQELTISGDEASVLRAHLVEIGATINETKE